MSNNTMSASTAAVTNCPTHSTRVFLRSTIASCAGCQAIKAAAPAYVPGAIELECIGRPVVVVAAAVPSAEESLAAAVELVPGVVKARVWRGESTTRIYATLRNQNGKQRNRQIIVDVDAMVASYDAAEWAGAKTREWHAANGTLALVRATLGPSCS